MPTSFEDFINGLSDEEFDKVSAMDETEMRAAAHIVNGGEALFPCPSCKGSGRFVSYSGRTVGNCFKCKGSGKVGKRVLGAAKAKITREENDRKRRAEFADAHVAEIEYVNKRAERSTFFASLQSKMNEYGNLTENQLAAVRRSMAEDAAKREQWAKEREENAPVVDISAIEALFAVAVDNDIKRPIFRAEGLEISKAPAHGANAGALYVKSSEDVYLGKIANGKFYATRGNEGIAEQLMEVAKDPTAAAIKYGRRTGRCGCCGRGLVDPVSIRSGIGPICAEKWGLDYRREWAREDLANEKEQGR